MADQPSDEGALRNVALSSFKPVNFHYDRVHTTGGHLKTALPMTTQSGPGGEIYVKMSTNEKWLMMATANSRNTEAHMFGKASLLRVLREHVERASNGEETSCIEDDDADAHADADAEHDPMNDIQCDKTDSICDQSGIAIRGRGAKRCRFYKNVAKKKLVSLDLPTVPPEVIKDSRDKRTIQLWIVDRRQVWLRISDVPWAVKYLFIQALLKGVPLIPPDAVGPSGPSAN